MIEKLLNVDLNTQTKLIKLVKKDEQILVMTL